MTVSVRAADVTDLEAVATLMRAYFAFDGISFDEVRIRSGLAQLLAQPALGWVFLAMAGGEPVGYAVATLGFDLEFGGRQATLTDLYLAPAHRRAGGGTQLLSHVEEACREADALAIELQAETDNAEAIAFYAAHGFVPHTRLPMSKRLINR